MDLIRATCDPLVGGPDVTCHTTASMPGVTLAGHRSKFTSALVSVELTRRGPRAVHTEEGCRSARVAKPGGSACGTAGATARPGRRMCHPPRHALQAVKRQGHARAIQR